MVSVERVWETASVGTSDCGEWKAGELLDDSWLGGLKGGYNKLLGGAQSIVIQRPDHGIILSWTAS